MARQFNFWDQVDKSAGSDGCWPWTGAIYITRGGYGCASRNGKSTRAHRLAFELTHGRKPNGYICHTCDNPPCCNPAHLFEGTPLSNMRDKIAKHRHRFGERHPRAKLSDRQIIAIRDARSLGETTVSLGRRFGVSHTTISRVVLKKNWSHVGAA